MSLGVKHHGHCEYYGSTTALYAISLAGSIGFAAPVGFVAWWLTKNPVRFCLRRTLLIATTMLAAVLGLAGWEVR